MRKHYIKEYKDSNILNNFSGNIFWNNYKLLLILVCICLSLPFIFTFNNTRLSMLVSFMLIFMFILCILIKPRMFSFASGTFEYQDAFGLKKFWNTSDISEIYAIRPLFSKHDVFVIVFDDNYRLVLSDGNFSGSSDFTQLKYLLSTSPTIRTEICA
jgi:hypothetical protein